MEEPWRVYVAEGGEVHIWKSGLRSGVYRCTFWPSGNFSKWKLDKDDVLHVKHGDNSEWIPCDQPSIRDFLLYLIAELAMENVIEDSQ